MAVEAAHAMRISAVTGTTMGLIAMVPLEAFLPVAMPLTFPDKNNGVRS
jgi:hypothetical protein